MAMNDLLHTITHRPDAWILLTIPFAAAAVGWLSARLAVVMLLRPADFLGVRAGATRLGWQGAVPAAAGRLAGIMADQALSRGAPLSDMLRALGPERLARQITDLMRDDLEDAIDQVMREHDPRFWESLPLMVRRRVQARARRRLPEVMESLVEDLSANIEALADLRGMMLRDLPARRAALAQAFAETDHAGLRGIARAGAALGLLLGLGLAVLHALHPQGGIMPVAGSLTGLAAGGLALFLCICPRHPVALGPWRLQGLFMRRRDALAGRLSTLAASEIITPGQVLAEALAGPNAHLTRAIVKRHLRRLLESGALRPAMQLGMRADGRAGLVGDLAGQVMTMMRNAVSDPRFNHERSGIMAPVFRERLTAMTDVSFQALLLAVFTERARTLLVACALLGGISGLPWLFMPPG